MNNISGDELSGPELFFGLVGPVGADLDAVQQELSKLLTTVGYNSSHIRVSAYLEEYSEHLKSAVPTTYDDRIVALQDAGNAFRHQLNRSDAIALAAISQIRQRRKAITGDARRPARRHAYIIRQMKTPEEVNLLRQVYGDRFILLGITQSEKSRMKALMERIAQSYAQNSRSNAYVHEAQQLMERDMIEDDPLGQNVRDTYPLSDLFINGPEGPDSERWRINTALARFVELLFCHPNRTPTVEEYLMFQAHAVAMRSADLSRQVGAVIANSQGSVIAVGMNEVPKVGGGPYLDGESPDRRDYRFKLDRTHQLRRETLGEVLERLAKNGWLTPDIASLGTVELIDRAEPLVRGTRLMGIGEFGRTVHAEMAALMDAARRGVAVKDSVLFTTTFPCQNCAKHIIDAGIRTVVYMEPYPKSLAGFLHDELINVPMRKVTEDSWPPAGVVALSPFAGIAPRRYLSLFTMSKRRDSNGNAIEWDKVAKIPKVMSPELASDHTQREEEAMQALLV